MTQPITPSSGGLDEILQLSADQLPLTPLHSCVLAPIGVFEVDTSVVGAVLAEKSCVALAHDVELK